MFKQNKIIDDWNNCSDEWFSNTKFDELFSALDKDPYKDFPQTMAAMIKEYYPDLKGKNVCVPSCGDNTAVFSFCALGAKVTATDISYKQIENARKIAEKMSFNVNYHVCDSMKLNELSDNIYDLVYTSNGVHVWINDLNAMYSNIDRILKKDGKYMLFDTHPFGRPFDSKKVDKGIFEIFKPYEEVGSFGEVPNFHWRIQDYVNALIKSGFVISRMEEFHSVIDDIPACNYLSEESDINHDNFNWHSNRYAALPQCLGLCSHKV
ncbi:class I SAM-dependent methyltransferase [Desnuesiella massiliensis]|uniref:class I SAM-dependent methyltransferase n=1 Tax=Desnuesiella massiliensis TaxID=1650662 RepID=UPI0006E2A993|nr:class I SAM-dependent methyltransferase [Desnuesiella massiliensis]